jgi:hypothetical protein
LNPAPPQPTTNSANYRVGDTWDDIVPLDSLEGILNDIEISGKEKKLLEPYNGDKKTMIS